MTILVLDPGVEPLAPYADWFAGHDEVVLFTGAPPDTVAPPRRTGYADVVHYADYAESGRVELDAVELAGRSALSGLVATACVDLIRAAALRAYLGLPGQSAATALARVDLIALRRMLAEGGLPTVPCGAVRGASDLFWLAGRWRYPIRIRRLRADGWPTVALLRDEDEVAAFAAATFTEGFDALPGLMAEPASTTGARIVVTDPPRPGRSLAGAAATLFPAEAGCEHVVTLSEVDGPRPLIDSVVLRPRGQQGLRLLARSQAGSPFRAKEQV